MDLSYAATQALWQFASKNRILQNLQPAFEKIRNQPSDVGYLSAFRQGGGINRYEDCLPDNRLPVSAHLGSERINEVLAQVDHEDIINYFRLRYDRSKEKYQKWFEKIKVYIALDSTAISIFSMRTEDAAYGRPRYNPEPKPINLAAAVFF